MRTFSGWGKLHVAKEEVREVPSMKRAHIVSGSEMEVPTCRPLGAEWGPPLTAHEETETLVL